MKKLKSVRVKHQFRDFEKKFTEQGQEYTIRARVRHDDECGNGHNSFSITGDVFAGGRWEMGGCIHEEIEKHFPELKPLIRFHLFDTDGGPMHYLANTVYLAGERDCHGLLKGEFRQFKDLRGVPNWELKIYGLPEKQDIYSMVCPARPHVHAEWVPCGRTGEGKARELDKARAAACWPDATDEDLTAPGLEERLQARLPKLMKEFKAAVESLGMTF